MRIVVNTSCAVAGGAVTYLRHLLPAMEPYINGDEITAIGDAATRELLSPPPFVRWAETPPLRGGLARRLARENLDLPHRLRTLSADVLFHPGNFRVFRTDVPQVILIHSLAPFLREVIEGESLQQRVRLRLLRGLTRFSLDRVSEAIFISEWGRRLVLGCRNIGERRMPVIPFGSEHAAARSEGSTIERWSLEAGKYVLSVSHLYRYKKLEKLIDAWIELGDRVAQWPLLVVGEPFDLEYSKRMEQRARLAKSRVIFTGSLDADVLPSLMANCRVFVFTSEAENLPITLLEAMAAGCTIVTNRHCSMPEICGEAALYADPALPETYRQQLDRVLWDEALRSEMRNRALQRADRFRWGDAARETLDVLRDVGMRSERRMMRVIGRLSGAAADSAS